MYLSLPRPITRAESRAESEKQSSRVTAHAESNPALPAPDMVFS